MEDKISQLNLGYDTIKKVWFDRYGRTYNDDEVQNGDKEECKYERGGM